MLRRLARFALPPSVLALLLVGLAACWAPDSDAPAAESTPVVEIPVVAPEEVGLSAEGLERIGPAMQELVDSGTTAGVMTLVARDGKIAHWEATGWRVLGEQPLERTDVFRIYSMTKPVTAVAAMMLVESGHLALDDLVSQYIPAFADVGVYEAGGTRPPSRAMTIEDLLSHRAGLTYGIFGTSAVDSMYVATRLLDQIPGRNLEAWANDVAAMPLLADPGTAWVYSVSLDVLGRVIEVASGRPLDEYFRSRIFEPLGMHETQFYVPESRWDRLAVIYGPGPDGLGAIEMPTGGPFTQPPAYFSGGGGLTSTAMDYLRFAQMLLNGGALDGVRILQVETVAEMSRNRLPESMMPIVLGGDDAGYGLGFGVSTNTGAYWWAGLANTYFWIDPVNDIVGMAWTQYMPFGAVPINQTLQQMVYGAMLEPVAGG